MVERLTVRKVTGWPLEKDPGCVFKGHAPQEVSPCRSSLHKHPRLVAAKSQVLAPTPQYRGSKGSDKTCPYHLVNGLTKEMEFVAFKMKGPLDLPHNRATSSTFLMRDHA